VGLLFKVLQFIIGEGCDRLMARGLEFLHPLNAVADDRANCFANSYRFLPAVVAAKPLQVGREEVNVNALNWFVLLAWHGSLRLSCFKVGGEAA
jgi:hypothetical protein